MPLEINTQLNRFIQFAEQSMQAGKATAKAQVGGAAEGGALAGRTIVAKSGDFIGNVGRMKASREVNDTARTLFRQAIADMFGGDDRIPDSVKDAMKLADFGKGKPLTARRIMAVKAAIDQVAEKFNGSLERSLTQFHAPDKNLQSLYAKGDVDGLIKTAFMACRGNADAMDILSSNISVLQKNIVTGDWQLRSPEQVQRRVENIVDNLNELKAATKNNPMAYAFGKELIQTLGKALPQGVLAKIVQSVKAASVADIRKLTGSSSCNAIHKAAKQMSKAVNEAMVFSGAEAKLDGAEEKEHVRAFASSVLLSRLGHGTLDKLRNAMDSQNAAKLDEYYSLAGKGSIDFDGTTENIARAASDAASICCGNLGRLSDGVNHVLSVLEPGRQLGSINDIEGELDLNDIGLAVVNDTVELGKELLAETVRNTVDATVQGKGQAADAFKPLLMKKLEGVHDPSRFLAQRLGATAKAMMNWNISAEMKKFATGESDSCQFKKDIDRNTHATLKFGGKTITLTNEYNKARDELAQFVTGDDKATYAGIANNPTALNKVHLLMSIISQETEKAGENGVQLAMDPREGDMEFTISGPKNKEGTVRTFDIELRKDGSLSVDYNMDKPVIDFNIDGEEYPAGAGSKFKCRMNYTLSGAEVDRLAKLDFSKFDDTKGYDIFNHKVDQPDGTRNFRDHKMEKIVDSFAEEFKIESKCRMDFTFEVNPTDEELANQPRA